MHSQFMQIPTIMTDMSEKKFNQWYHNPIKKFNPHKNITDNKTLAPKPRPHIPKLNLISQTQSKSANFITEQNRNKSTQDKPE